MNGREIRDLLRAEGFSYTRTLGQNFIFDDRILASIADAAALSPDEGVLEIGPGAGTLTGALAARAGRVVAVEKDARLLPLLARTLAGIENVTVLNADFLELDLKELERRFFPAGYSVAANLPYYITTPILFAVFESDTAWRSLTVMVQKEVAQRLCAAPGTKDYGVLTLTAGYYAAAATVLSVPRSAFTPQPDVDSVVVRLTRRPVPAISVKNETLLFRLIRAGFAMRRKTLLNNLCAAFPLSRQEGDALLTACRVDPARRGETLSLAEYGVVADALAVRISL